jgi:hypothetical protein
MREANGSAESKDPYPNRCDKWVDFLHEREGHEFTRAVKSENVSAL